MNEEIRTKWVEELRSGKWLQGKNWMRFDAPEGERYCCLGVLCCVHEELHGGATWIPFTAGAKEMPITGKGYRMDGDVDRDDQRQLPPPYVIDWAGLHPTQVTFLAFCNDRGAEFSTIADMLEDDGFMEEVRTVRGEADARRVIDGFIKSKERRNDNNVNGAVD